MKYFAPSRSRVRESIKPGKYGYGKLPFSLPLHRDVAEGTIPRFKRHHGERDGEPLPPPPPPPRPPPRKPKSKARRTSSREETVGREKEPPTSGSSPRTSRKSKAVVSVDGTSRPQRQVGEGPENGSGHGKEHGHLDGDRHGVYLATSEEKPRPTEPGGDTTLRNERSEEGERHAKLATDSPESPSGAHQPSPPVAPTDRQPQPPEASAESYTVSRETPHGTEDSGTSTETAALPPSQMPSPALGELRLTHQILRNQSAAPERKRPRTTPENQPDKAGHTSRSRNQRQNEPRPGSQGTRSSHALFVDRPVSPRPADPDIWLLHRGNPIQFHARGHGSRTDIRPEVEVPQWNLYYPGTETFHCEGESKQFKACRQEVRTSRVLFPRPSGAVGLHDLARVHMRLL